MTSVGQIRHIPLVTETTPQTQPKTAESVVFFGEPDAFSPDNAAFSETPDATGDLVYALEFIDDPEIREIKRGIPMIHRLKLDWFKPFL